MGRIKYVLDMYVYMYMYIYIYLCVCLAPKIYDFL
jgi:hypothetical protein